MITELRHRVKLCSQKDVVSTPGELQLARAEVLTTWASINAKKGSTFSPTGMAMKDNRNLRTHEIIIRYRPDIEISAMAWIFEERRKSSPRWFKVLTCYEKEIWDNPYYVLDCRIVERSDLAEQPQQQDGLATPLRPGVSL